MASVTYDDRSFLIDGKRVWLVSGSIHYFRLPADLWRDRLLKAKRAGLNCITTYVAWNFHEPTEGKLDMTGDRDLTAFIRMAGELGLYVILRPGPYICAEWDFGGLPAWLTTKSGLAYRTSNAVYTHYYDKFFRQILPGLAELQVSRGGNIILIQNENEYTTTTMPDRLAYLEFISQIYRRSGFDIPIINCNTFTDPPVGDSVECVNGWSNEVQQLKRMRLRQPHAPLLVTEFWGGWFDQWGGEHSRRDDRETARRAMDILGCGAQFNYYMWHGGTNFAFWASRLPGGDSRYQTTSYDYDAPLPEGGGLTRKYYLTRLVNMLAQHMGRFFASTILEQPGVSVHDSTQVLNLTGTLCNWAIVTNNGKDDISTARISLPEGQELIVPLEPIGAAAIPVELDLTSSLMLDYSNLTPLGFFGEKVLVLHGPVGWEGRVSINGQEIQAVVPKTNEPVIHELKDIVIAFVNSETAMRTWLVNDDLIFGPSFVGDSIENIVDAPGAKQYAVLSIDGKLSHQKALTTRRTKPTAPRLGQWKRLAVCDEMSKKDLDWTKLPGPRDVDRLGVYYGYVWYRIEMQQDRAGKRQLFLPNCEDRAAMFLNGKPLATWGRGDGAQRTPVGANFKKGTNVLTILADNLGRVNYGSRIGERKGLFGHVYDAKPLRHAKFKLTALDSFSKRLIPRQHTANLLRDLQNQKVWAADINISLTKVLPIHLSFTDLPYHLAVLCNDRVVAFFDKHVNNFGDVTLGSELRKGKNSLRLMLWGDVSAGQIERQVKLFSLVEPISEGARWSWRPWAPPPNKTTAAGRDLPAWYATHFKYTKRDEPLFLHVAGAKKGQIYLNGHNLGRFWAIGPQHDYYLPACWLQDNNELLLFDEQGKSPAPSKLAFLPFGPFRKD